MRELGYIYGRKESAVMGKEGRKEGRKYSLCGLLRLEERDQHVLRGMIRNETASVASLEEAAHEERGVGLRKRHLVVEVVPETNNALADLLLLICLQSRLPLVPTQYGVKIVSQDLRGIRVRLQRHWRVHDRLPRTRHRAQVHRVGRHLSRLNPRARRCGREVLPDKRITHAVELDELVDEWNVVGVVDLCTLSSALLSLLNELQPFLLHPLPHELRHRGVTSVKAVLLGEVFDLRPARLVDLPIIIIRNNNNNDQSSNKSE